jgi:hypothetical protein
MKWGGHDCVGLWPLVHVPAAPAGVDEAEGDAALGIACVDGLEEL